MLVALTVGLVAACTTRGSIAVSPSGRLEVVAVENSWGSIAAQLGGDRVTVTNIITNPDTDPHEYEPTVRDARAIASAHLVIFNGLGYDAWAGATAKANHTSGQSVLDIGAFLGLRDGDNPHRWYFPDDVRRVVAQITAEYQRLDARNSSYYDDRRREFETVAMKRYDDLLAEIRTTYASTPVGASESLFVGLAAATKLDLRTPAGFLDAISEGTDPSADDKATVDRQIEGRAIAVFVYNVQNATPDVQALVDEARVAHVEVVTMTEALPANATFQDWQADQLDRLEAALARARRS